MKKNKHFIVNLFNKYIHNINDDIFCKYTVYYSTQIPCEGNH